MMTLLLLWRDHACEVVVAVAVVAFVVGRDFVLALLVVVVAVVVVLIFFFSTTVTTWTLVSSRAPCRFEWAATLQRTIRVAIDVVVAVVVVCD
jgi:hypothetical protein